MVLCLHVACDSREQTADQSAPAPAGVIDSALPIAEHLRRFRATLTARADTFSHASATADALVDRWLRAVAARDTATLRTLHLDRAEFADLVYEQLRIAKPPYEMAPALLWFQLTENSEDGIRRSLERLGGRAVSLRSLRCPTPIDTQGVLRLRDGCLLRLRVDRDTLPEDRFFGSIVERDGRLKFVGYSNKL
jgi:hypothetical protein